MAAENRVSAFSPEKKSVWFSEGEVVEDTVVMGEPLENNESPSWYVDDDDKITPIMGQSFDGNDSEWKSENEIEGDLGMWEVYNESLKEAIETIGDRVNTEEGSPSETFSISSSEISSTSLTTTPGREIVDDI